MTKGTVDRSVSLQENENQFLFLQALRRRPPSRHHVSLHKRAVARLGDVHAAIPATPDVDETDKKNIDRNSMICKAVVILWRSHERMRAWRKWTEVAAAEAGLRRAAHVAHLRSASLELLRRRPPSYTPEEVALLEEWARQLQEKIFHDLSPDRVTDIVRHMTLTHYRARECLFLEGDVGHGYYILIAGSISIYVDMPTTTKGLIAQGRTHALEAIRLDAAMLGQYRYDIGEGDGFGEVAMFSSDHRRTASAVASSACDVIEIPKDVYDRTLRRAQYEAYSTAQKLAFLPTVNIFSDWLHAKLVLLLDLLDRREVPFGQYLLNEDKPFSGVYFVLTGHVHIMQKLCVAPQTPSHVLKSPIKKAIPITVDTISRRGIIGIQALVEHTKTSKYSAVVATDKVECLVLTPDHFETFRGLLQATNHTHLKHMWQELETARATKLGAAAAAFNTTDGPPLPHPPQPPPKLRYQRERGDDVLPVMTSMAGKKFVFHDFDLLVEPVPVPLAPSSLPKMTLLARSPIPAAEQAKVVAQHFATLKPRLWDPARGFVQEVLPLIEKVDMLRPERPALPAFERSLASTRRKARTIASEHSAFTNARRTLNKPLVSYKHAF
ncbi:hypothetical protein ACHHYP_16629 [Achlya hypogyna]|uniref:Cyclic nucleotide-binding domain-containing protein n=1 Tax=Achlya hypogyna TaxID=1202772 RepID=A0A1V9Y6G3_ACHHY|nr:hypothetical protein ACHHYP_16629 [Achlya hypogyna]